MKKNQIYIGCSAYYNRHWKPVFYPEKLPQRLWLPFYCQHFNTLELNSTFYRFPTDQSLKTSFFDKSPDDFIFSVKAPKVITHLKKFNDCAVLVDDFYTACAAGLQHKLGCVLFQLPPSIHYNEEKLDEIVSYMNPDFKNVIEFRHVSWWTNEVYDRLAEKNITFCSISHPTLPETIITNTPVAFIRIHGNPKLYYSDYTDEDREALHRAILKNKELKETYIYFNNTASTSGVLNALQMKKLSLKQ